MGSSVFLVVNLVVGAILLILLFRFAWNMWYSTAYYPAEWTRAVQDGRLSGDLISLARKFPDKSRFFSWWLQADRLEREKIPGDFAEVGVYKGESARALHLMGPERKLHLFDTFEGFERSDLASERGEAASYTSRHFADTSVRAVLDRIRGGSQIVIHKGVFPETAAEAEGIRFALVNLDADLYRPTKAALEFFYPRLAPGGVIFIHDHNFRWEGIKKAVEEFTALTGVVPILLPDPDSTVIFVKPKK